LMTRQFVLAVATILAGLSLFGVNAFAQSGPEEESDDQEIILDGLEALPPSGTVDLIDDVELGDELIDDVLIDDAQTPDEGGQKWIGLMCHQVSDLVRAQLALPEDAGLVVQEVVADGPAKEIGLQQHDILVKASGKPLTSLRQLIDIVHDSPAAGFELEWLRRGETMVATVVPATRPFVEPQKLRRRLRGLRSGAQNMGRLREWIDQLGNEEDDDGPLGLRFFGDLQPSEALEYPQNLSVQIQRNGNEPARIKVQRGEDSWELSEEDIDQLPDDIRPHVEQMLGGGAQWQVGPDDRDARPFPWRDPFPGLERQMDEVREQMERMFEELRELRESDRFQEDEEEVEPGVDA